MLSQNVKSPKLNFSPNGVIMNTLTPPTYMHDANEFIIELKSIKTEIDSTFTKKTRYHIIQDGKALLKSLSEKINFYCNNNTSTKINLKEIDYFLNLAIQFAESPNIYFSSEKNNSPQYSKLWKKTKNQLKRIYDISESIHLISKQYKKKAAIIICYASDKYALSSEILEKLEKNLLIFNKKAVALLDFYEPPFSNKKISQVKLNNRVKLVSPSLKRAEKTRALLIENREAIISYMNAPLIPPRIRSVLEAQRKRGQNYAMISEQPSKISKISSTSEKNPN